MAGRAQLFLAIELNLGGKPMEIAWKVILGIAYLAAIVVCFKKGKTGFGWLGVVGLFPWLTPFLGWFPVVGAVRYAKPNSGWAQDRYGPTQMATANRRFPEEESVSTETTDAKLGAITRWWLIGAGALMAIGSFLPWEQVGILSYAGTADEYGIFTYGIFTLIGGVVVALVGVANRASILTGVGTMVASGFSIWIILQIVAGFLLVPLFNLIATMFGVDVIENASLGSRVYLTGLASLFAFIGGLKIFVQALIRRIKNLRASSQIPVELP